MANSKAYVLIEVAAGLVPGVVEALRSIDGVAFAHAITGQYDVIASIEADSINHLGKISYGQIQRIEGVLRTITCNVVEI